MDLRTGTATPRRFLPGTRVLMNDETLSRRLAGIPPSSSEHRRKIEILHLMESLGIDRSQYRFFSSRRWPRAYAHTRKRWLGEIATLRMKELSQLRGANPLENDIPPHRGNIAGSSIAIEAQRSFGSSRFRRLVEDWTVDHSSAPPKRR